MSTRRTSYSYFFAGQLLAVLAFAAAVPGCSFWKGFQPLPGAGKAQPAGLPPGVVLPRERLKSWQASVKAAKTPEERAAVAGQLQNEFAREQDPFLRREILRLVAKLDDSTAAAMASSAVNDPAELVRVEACGILGTVGGSASVSVLAGALQKETSPDVKQAIIQALGNAKDPSAVPVLADLLDERDPAFQYLAMQSLRQVTGRDFGNDVRQWEAYVRGEEPPEKPAASLANRVKDAIF